MPDRVLNFHFDYLSPYSYLAWHRLAPLAGAYALDIRAKPTLLAALLNEHGHKGPGEIMPKRAYMFRDCIRGAAALGVPFEPPASHPFNPLPSLRATLLEMSEAERRELVTRLFAATWVESRDVGSPEVVAEVCASVGILDPLERIQSPAIKRELLERSRRALSLGIFGVPTMIVEGELFWGTDSVGHLERFLRGDDPVDLDDIDRWASVPPSAHR